MSVLTWIAIWLAVKKYNSLQLGDMLCKLLQTPRDVIEMRSEI